MDQICGGRESEILCCVRLCYVVVILEKPSAWDEAISHDSEIARHQKISARVSGVLNEWIRTQNSNIRT